MTTRLTDRTNSRCLKRVEIAPEMIVEALKMMGRGVRCGAEIIRVAENPVPDSAQVVMVSLTEQGCVSILLEDDSFPALHKDAVVARLNLTLSLTIEDEAQP